jgi:hypothetical protein
MALGIRTAASLCSAPTLEGLGSSSPSFNSAADRSFLTKRDIPPGTPPWPRQCDSLLHAAALPSKGRLASFALIACAVPGLTPKRSAITRTPSVRPGAFRAYWIRSFSSGAIGGRPRRLPSLRAL